MELARAVADELSGMEGSLTGLDSLETFRAYLSRPAPEEPGSTRDAYPQSVAAVIVPTGLGAQVAVADMVWGFQVPWKKGVVFNTRLESALEQPEGMWAESFARRRCVVCAQAFFESHATQRVPSARTGKPIRRPYVFTRNDGAPLLLAGIHDKGRFSIVTTAPNKAVAPVHDRMPLVLSPAEAARWLAGDARSLADRSAFALSSRPEA